MRRFIIGSGVVCAASALSPGQTVFLKVTVENLSPANGAALSPFTMGFHDGTFDPFNLAAPANLGIRNIAELGDGTVYLQDFEASQPQGVSGVLTAETNAFGPGIFLPGGRGSHTFRIDAGVNRFFAFGSMVVPSNDRFLGNDQPIELFDTNGVLTNPGFTLTGANIWDARTEVDAHFGAAFIAGQNAMQHVPENGVIGLNSDFSPYSGVTTAAGYTFDVLPTPTAPIARISFTIVPAPASMALLGLAGSIASRRRRPA